MRLKFMHHNWRRIPPTSLLILGALALTVFVVACGGAHSSPKSNENPIPSIASLSPSSEPTGSSPQALMINGTGFLTTSTVTFNGVVHTSTYVNPGQLTILLTVADLANAGSYAVVVTNPAPGGGASAALTFSVVANNPIPSIITLSPASLVVGATPQTLAITGAGFLASSTVLFNGITHSSTYVSANQLSILLTSSDLATVGNYPVVVTNPLPGGGSSASATFGVWNIFTDPTSHISIPFPELGSTPTQVTTFPTAGGISSLDINGWSSAQEQAVPVVGISLIPNTSALSLQQWFETNVDIDGLLQAAATYHSQQFSNKVVALILVGPLPSEYLDIGSPTDEVYAISPDGKYIISMTEAQQAQLSDFGYDPSSLFAQVLGAMTFN